MRAAGEVGPREVVQPDLGGCVRGCPTASARPRRLVERQLDLQVVHVDVLLVVISGCKWAKFENGWYTLGIVNRTTDNRTAV